MYVFYTKISTFFKLLANEIFFQISSNGLPQWIQLHGKPQTWKKFSAMK